VTASNPEVMPSSGAGFDCDAYGSGGREFGALCFISGEPGARVCASLTQCRTVMSAERRRLWDRIQELAAQGDETAVFLAQEFSRPEQLLGGTGEGSTDGPV